MTARLAGCLTLWATTSCVSLFVASPVLALDWGSYSDARHNRFYEPQSPPDPPREFIGENFDWSGVGTFNSSGWWWATMISDQYFLSAFHIQPSNDPADVRFYRTNDPNGQYVDVGIDTSFGKQIAGTDLWLGKLKDAPPDWVHRYPLIKRDDSTNWVSYLDPTIYLVGYEGNSASYTNMRVGKNAITSPWSWSQARLAAGRTLEYSFDTGPSGFGVDEARTIPGDSSGPTFVNSPLGLALAGIHWQENADSDISSNLTELIKAVPEPVTVVTDLAGDVNADFQVSIMDLLMIASPHKAQAGLSYTDGDVNGDGSVNGFDLTSSLLSYGKKLVAPADFDHDFDVDDTDLTVIYDNMLKSVSQGTNGDANSDGVVNALDLIVFQQNFRPANALAGFPAQNFGSHVGVPEPSGIILFTAATLIILTGTRRRAKDSVGGLIR